MGAQLHSQALCQTEEEVGLSVELNEVSGAKLISTQDTLSPFLRLIVQHIAA